MSTNQKDEPIIQPSTSNVGAQFIAPTSEQPSTTSTTSNVGAQFIAPTSDALDSATKQELIAALRQNWQREMEGVRTYRGLAQRERDTARRNILTKMADAEQRHAQKWEQKLAELGVEPPQEQRSLKMRFQGWLRRQLGTDAALRQLEGEEDKDIARYEAQARSINDVEAQTMLREVRREEESHGRVIREIIGPIGPQGMLDVMLRRER